MTKTDTTPISKIEDTSVYCVIKPLTCFTCGIKLTTSDFEVGQLCLKCAGLGHLVFLEKGNSTLTKRSRKHSIQSAVVKRFNKSRKVYDIKGYLVEPEAIAKAEEESKADESKRAIARERAAIKRGENEIKYVDKFLQQIIKQYPSCPVEEAEFIAEHACEKHSGRVGRSASAKKLNETPVTLAVRAHIRHNHTKYDELMTEGWGKNEAKDFTVGDVDRIEIKWKNTANNHD